MSDNPFIDGNAPKAGGKESESARQEWEQTEKPKKFVGMIALVVLIVGGGIGMAVLMKATAPEDEAVEVTDKSQYLSLTNTTDALAWVDCVIGDPEDGGMEYSKKLSSKEKTLVELQTLPVACTAKDEAGTEYWSWRGMKYGSAEEGILVSIKRDTPAEKPAEKPDAPEPAGEPEEG